MSNHFNLLNKYHNEILRCIWFCCCCCYRFVDVAVIVFALIQIDCGAPFVVVVFFGVAILPMPNVDDDYYRRHFENGPAPPPPLRLPLHFSLCTLLFVVTFCYCFFSSYYLFVRLIPSVELFVCFASIQLKLLLFSSHFSNRFRYTSHPYLFVIYLKSQYLVFFPYYFAFFAFWTILISSPLAAVRCMQINWY